METQTRLYAYTGPLSSVTLNVDGEELDVLLNPKTLVALPPEHPYTLALIAQKRLVAMPSPDSPAPQAADEPAQDDKPRRGKGAQP